jgi:dTDP-4-dehydrorhamnose reductase
MRILILGAGGQLVQELAEALAGEQVLGLTLAQADICDAPAIERHIRSFRPDCLINTAAFHRVDECEDRIDESFAVNALAVNNLVRAANKVRAMLIHFSTDYVFGGIQRRPYRETDAPNPLSIYAMSKLVGEQIVQRYADRYFLIRTSGLYESAGRRTKRGNFVETMLRLAETRKSIRVVND